MPHYRITSPIGQISFYIDVILSFQMCVQETTRQSRDGVRENLHHESSAQSTSQKMLFVGEETSQRSMISPEIERLLGHFDVH